MRIAIDADANGEGLKRVLCALLTEKGAPFEDLAYLTSHDGDYPDVALHLARALQQGRFDRGILICGTGLGMAMTACKVPGIFAGTCHDVYSAERLRKSNDAQILCLGAQVVGPEAAKAIVSAWLTSEFQGGRSTPKVTRMREIDAEQRGHA